MSLPLTHAGLSAPGISAALDLKFASTLSLTSSSGITPSFSRASTGSYFDSTGTLRYANVNLITYSERFDNAAWTANGLNAGVSVNLINAPDGTQNADKLFETNVNGGHYLNQTSSITTGNPYTFTIYVKKENRSWIQIAYNSAAFGVNAWANFDVNNGVVGNKGSSATANITSVGSGWYRCSITATSTATATSGPVICLLDTDANSRLPSYLGDGSSGLYIWGAQLELASSPTQYAKTEASTTAGPRFDHVYSGGQWISRGLLIEEQRTNLAQYSEDFANAYWTKQGVTISNNSSLSPDGTATADKLVESSLNEGHAIYTVLSVANGSSYTTSVFAKPAGRNYLLIRGDLTGSFLTSCFDLSNGTITRTATGYTAKIQNVGNGWFKCSVTATSSVTSFAQVFASFDSAITNDGNPAYLGDGVSGILLWGAQLETGSFPTSYIPTTTTSVVRSADVCQITGADFTSFWNASEGSVVAEYDFLAAPADRVSPRVWYASDGAYTNGMWVQSGSSDGFYVYQGGASQAGLTATALPSGSTAKFSSAYRLNDFAASFNGAAVLTDTSGNVPTVNRMEIGYVSDISGRVLNGHIARLRYYAIRLPNRLLIAKSQ